MWQFCAHSRSGCPPRLPAPRAAGRVRALTGPVTDCTSRSSSAAGICLIPSRDRSPPQEYAASPRVIGPRRRNNMPPPLTRYVPAARISDNSAWPLFLNSGSLLAAEPLLGVHGRVHVAPVEVVLAQLQQAVHVDGRGQNPVRHLVVLPPPQLQKVHHLGVVLVLDQPARHHQ
eukprot:853203-Prorocentrum_minimum.AAC.1